MRHALLRSAFVLTAWLSGCALNWDPLLPSACGGENQHCCDDAGAPCQGSLSCASGTCRCSGTSCQAPCSGIEVRCGAACVDISTNSSNCGQCAHACLADEVCSSGACSTMCTSGQVLCSGSCVDLNTSAANCGTCGASCESTLPHANATCLTGSCQFGACASGFGDCDANPSNGCETSLASDPLNCGACGMTCNATANATAACANATCSITCMTGFGDCNAIAADGCETHTAGDPTHCGACGTTCPSGPNATPGCTTGTCSLVCATGFADCDHVATNGCEVTLATDDVNCGSCGTRCVGHRVCTGGTCI